MIRRFKLEAEGISPWDCARQINTATLEIFKLDGSTMKDWEVTDDVTWKMKGGYASRAVLKRKEKEEQ